MPTTTEVTDLVRDALRQVQYEQENTSAAVRIQAITAEGPAIGVAFSDGTRAAIHITTTANGGTAQ